MSSGQIQNDSEIKFIADTMLGRLAKWLRILGYDTLYPGQESDQRLARIAAEEGRILLTRDTELASRKGFRKLLVDSDRLAEQLSQVIEAFHLKTNDRILSLCLLCNCPLREIQKDSVRDKVPPYVFQTQSRFFQCPECDKIFWPGTHLDHIRTELERLGFVL
ncbi:MAG: Mut7-C RNAse domain-containing protein [Gemmatimonadota bacterium]|nr:MAG: Mut7-C RNAse domain-containing protein [Gemmatimonadota bacterium]